MGGWKSWHNGRQVLSDFLFTDRLVLGGDGL
ncbi:MAG: hypothetical protein RIS70_219, partial [Planctomycetota bacterium]